MNSWKQEMFSSKEQQQRRELNQTHKKKSQSLRRRFKLTLQPKRGLFHVNWLKEKDKCACFQSAIIQLVGSFFLQSSVLVIFIR